MPDGRAFNLADGIVRARYRESPRRRSDPLEPGEPTAFSIGLWDLAHTFLPGHRIRLEISSSNFPRFDRNLNTGNEIGRDGPDGRGDGDAAGVPRRGAPERPDPAGRDRTRRGGVAMAQVENEIVAGFDALLGGAGDAERDAFFARCRAEAPIFFSEALGAWVLARYDDVRAVLEDHSYLTLTDGPGSPIYGRSMLQWEGVEHNKKSGPVVKRIRSPRAIRESIDGKVLEIATRTADDLPLEEPVDLRADYVMLVPLLVITELLDIHEAGKFRSMYDAIMKGGISSIADPSLRVAAFEALDSLREIVAPIVEERRLRPGSDMISDLATASYEGQPYPTRRSSPPSPSCSPPGSRPSSGR